MQIEMLYLDLNTSWSFLKADVMDEIMCLLLDYDKQSIEFL